MTRSGLHFSNIPPLPTRSGSRRRLALLLPALLLGLTGSWLCVPSGWAHEKKPKLQILRVEDAPDPFSPNEDGRNDTATIHIEIGLFKKFGRKDVLEVTTVLRSSAGERVRTLKTRQALREWLQKQDRENDDEGDGDEKDKDERKPPRVLLIEQTWDGRDKAGQLVPDGTYAYTVRARVLRIKKEGERETDKREKDDGDKDDREDKKEEADERAKATPVAGSITLDVTPPTISATVDPPANAAGWHNSPVTVRFTCTDTSGIAACEPNQVVTTEGANQTIAANVVDNAGNLAQRVTAVSLDVGVPELEITSPADGTVVCTSTLTVTVTGTVFDLLSGIVSLTVNGADVPVSGGSFSHPLTLQDGLNTFEFVTTDGAGHTRQQLLRVTRRVPRYPFPQHIVYAPGTIRLKHKNQGEQDNDVRAFYDDWKAKFLVAGTTPGVVPLWRVAFGLPGTEDHKKTVSEGQGYGMVIVALMAGYDPDAQAIFDGLWEFSRAHTSKNNSRLMGWLVPTDPADNDSAFDGDADIAYGLLLADKQWCSEGRINYMDEAKNVIFAILERTIGPDSRLPMLGDWVDPAQWVHPDPNKHFRNQYTPRSSDFILGHFRAYGRATSDVATWKQVVLNSQTVIDSFQHNHSPSTGLLSDFIVVPSMTDHTPRPAPPDFLEGVHDGDYDYNAGRVPWRLGTDALLNNDPVTLHEVRKISKWAEREAFSPDPERCPRRICAGYELTGKPLRTDFDSKFFVAPLGVAAMTNACPPGVDPMTNACQQNWLKDIYDAVVSGQLDDAGYYQDTVTLLSLMVMTGNFWDPTTIGGP